MKENPETICFYNISTELGGAERSLLDLVTHLEVVSNGKFRPLVLLPKSSGSLIDQLKVAKIDYSILKMPRFFMKTSRETPVVSLLFGVLSLPALLGYCWRLCRLLKASQERKEIRLIHTSGIKCHLLAGILQPIHRGKVLWHLRDILRPGPIRSLLRWVRSFTGISVIANSEATRRSFDSSDKAVEVIYNGLDPQVFFPNPNQEFRSYFGVGAETPIVGIVGALARWKGQLEFIQMGIELVRKGVNARFVIVGDQIYDTSGDQGTFVKRGYKKELQDTVEQSGLNSYFHFTGFLKDSVKVMNGLDLLVHASIRPEPFGRVILEAMACGVPVVASAAGGVLELIEAGKTGLLFPPGDIQSMEQKVELILGDLDGWKRKLRLDLDSVLKNYSIETGVKKIMNYTEAG